MVVHLYDLRACEAEASRSKFEATLVYIMSFRLVMTFSGRDYLVHISSQAKCEYRELES